MTFPALMQEVQTDSFLGVPPITVRTVWTFGDQRRFVRRCEWLMVLPNDGCFPQMSQTAAMELPWKVARIQPEPSHGTNFRPGGPDGAPPPPARPPRGEPRNPGSRRPARVGSSRWVRCVS